MLGDLPTGEEELIWKLECTIRDKESDVESLTRDKELLEEERRIRKAQDELIGQMLLRVTELHLKPSADVVAVCESIKRTADRMIAEHVGLFDRDRAESKAQTQRGRISRRMEKAELETLINRVKDNNRVILAWKNSILVPTQGESCLHNALRLTTDMIEELLKEDDK